jgi:cytochrome oxidase assembly protein ShyY1
VYRFLLSARWIGGFLLCVLAALICVRLGIWQLHRLHQKQAVNASISAARSAPPRPVADLLSTDRGVPGRQEYAQVEAVGRYDAANAYLVRNQQIDGRPGYLVLTPLETVDGPTLWVVRGWVPVSAQGVTAAPDVPEPPSGTVTVTGRIRTLDSGGGSRVRVAGTNQITRVTRGLLERPGMPTYRAYVDLVKQDPAGTGLTALPAPDDLDEGPHLAYFIQWNMFAVMFLAGYVIVARRKAHETDSGEFPTSSELTAPGTSTLTP